jgi:hypothetical protein
MIPRKGAVPDKIQPVKLDSGGSVECIVTFDDACQVLLGGPKAAVARYPLVDNFRSHPYIVTFFDDYIRAFLVMAKPGARAPKPPICTELRASGRLLDNSMPCQLRFRLLRDFDTGGEV